MSNIPVIQVGTGNETKVITPALLTAIGPDGTPVALKADANGQILTSGGGGTSADVVYDLSGIQGTVVLDFADGARQICWQTGDLTFGITGGANGDSLKLGMRWTNGSTITFDSSVKMPSGASTLLPITPTAWRALIFYFEKIGGLWHLISVSPELQEIED